MQMQMIIHCSIRSTCSMPLELSHYITSLLMLRKVQHINWKTSTNTNSRTKVVGRTVHAFYSRYFRPSASHVKIMLL